MCGFTSVVTTLIAVACSQFDKLKAAILDFRQQHITPHHRQEDEHDNTIVNCDYQAKLKMCIQHHQDIKAYVKKKCITQFNRQIERKNYFIYVVQITSNRTK